MTIINRQLLLEQAPLKNMLTTKERSHGVSHGLAEVGYDIRLKQDILFHPSSSRGSVVWVDGEHPEHMSYGRFCIASAIEEFDMPETLCGIVHDKSTWARRGLSVFNTVIEPGFKGGLTLELVYHGTAPLHVPAGVGIAQVIFHETAMPARYAGKYQGQSTEPTPAILE